MPLLLLLLLYLACLGSWSQPFWLPSMPDGASAAVKAQLEQDHLLYASVFSWSAIFLVIASAALAARRIRHRIGRSPQDRDAILRRYGNFRFYHMLGLFAAYALVLYVLGWGWIVNVLCAIPRPDFLPPGEASLLLPGAELLLLLPLILALVLSWICFYDAERALYDSAHALTSLRPFWSRSAYVGFHVRQNLAMVLVPVVMLIVMQGAHRLYPALLNSTEFQVMSFGLLFVLIACLPWVLRLVLGLRPMPAGPLRDHLLATAKRLDFRCSEIMLWNTRNGVANALVVGLFSRLRYVVLSDRLLADLAPDEVDAVFGHEAGHVKHNHMLYYLSFLLLSMGVLVSAWASLFESEAKPAVAQVARMEEPRAEEPLPTQARAKAKWQIATFEAPLLVGSLGAYIFVVFGFLSRRCERQADIFGCRAVSCGRSDCTGHDDVPLTANGLGLCPTGIRTFIHALEKVALLNGISRSKPGWLQSWQHSTIDRRVQFLQEMLVDPGLEPRFQRRVGIVKWVLMVGLVALFGVIEEYRAPIPTPLPGGVKRHAAITTPQTARHTVPSE